MSKEKLKDVFAYLNICGSSKSEHDLNLWDFLKLLKINLTLNDKECKFSLSSMRLLGFLISNKTMRPGPDRLKPLLELPLPNNPTSLSLKQVIGSCAHYLYAHCSYAFVHYFKKTTKGLRDIDYRLLEVDNRFLPKFSEKIQSLVNCKTFHYLNLQVLT